MGEGSREREQGTVREARRGDEEAIALLSGELGYPSSAAEIRARVEPLLRDPHHAVYVSQDGAGKLTGWIHVFLHRVVEADARAEVGGLVVTESSRGRGEGRRLLLRAEAWARERGCRRVSLRSNVVREEAHRFYEHLGYRRAKTQHTFLKGL